MAHTWKDSQHSRKARQEFSKHERGGRCYWHEGVVARAKASRAAALSEIADALTDAADTVYSDAEEARIAEYDTRMSEWHLRVMALLDERDSVSVEEFEALRDFAFSPDCAPTPEVCTHCGDTL